MEKIGLGTAVGGHALLFGALALGLLFSSQKLIQPKPIAVSLVGEVSDESTAPDATQEETAAASSAPENTPPDEAPPVPEVTPLPKLLPQPVPKPAPKPVKPVATPSAKPAVKKVTPQQQQAKPTTRVAQNTSGKGQTRAGGYSLPDAVANGKGKSNNDGKATGTPAVKTAAQYRSAASIAIGAEVKPFVPQCAPPASDNSSLIVFVALQIGRSANLIDANIYDVRGVTSTNQAQVELMKKCVLDSLRRASPYNLEPDGYDTWKNHKVQLKVNFK